MNLLAPLTTRFWAAMSGLPRSPEPAPAPAPKLMERPTERRPAIVVAFVDVVRTENFGPFADEDAAWAWAEARSHKWAHGFEIEPLRAPDGVAA